MPGGTELVDLVSPERHGPGRETYCGKVPHHGGLPVKGRFINSHRVDTVTISVQCGNKQVGPPVGGYVCDQTKQSVPTVCVASTGCRGMGGRRTSSSWNLVDGYAFPPFVLLAQVLQKIRQSDCWVTLVAPCWPTRSWFSSILELLVEQPVVLPVFPSLLSQHGGKNCIQILQPEPSRLEVIRE